MELHNLPKMTEKKLRRLGQGHGSGRGKTAGRGTKGQKARGEVNLFFEGGALPLIKRMPFLRGRGRNKVVKHHPLAVNIADLERLSGKVVDVDSLIKQKLVGSEAKLRGAKLIGNNEVKVAYQVKIGVSKAAGESITRAGGTVS